MSLRIIREIDVCGYIADKFSMHLESQMAGTSVSQKQQKSKRRAPIAGLPKGIHIIETQNGVGTKYWRVRLGKRFTGGQVRKRDFSSLAEARDWIFGSKRGSNGSPGIEQAFDFKAPSPGIITVKQALGASPFTLTPRQLGEAQDVFRRLKEKNFSESLTEVFEYFLRHAKPPAGTRMFSEIREEFLQSRVKRPNKRPVSASTLRQYNSDLNVICLEFGDSNLNEIGVDDIEDWLSEAIEWALKTKRNYLTTLGTIFRWAKRKGYCVRNPAAEIERPDLDTICEEEPGIVTVEQAKAILRAAHASDREMLPAIAIGLFAGLRRSEICRLDWTEVNLTDRHIVVKGTKAKTRRRRVVTIAENLVTWLSPFVQASGAINPAHSTDYFGERLSKITKLAGVDPWPRNALRHSFGSYFYGRTKNADLTAAEMGNSPGVVFRHYRALVFEKDADLYWKLTREAVLKA